MMRLMFSLLVLVISACATQPTVTDTDVQSLLKKIDAEMTKHQIQSLPVFGLLNEPVAYASTAKCIPRIVKGSTPPKVECWTTSGTDDYGNENKVGQ